MRHILVSAFVVVCSKFLYLIISAKGDYDYAIIKHAVIRKKRNLDGYYYIIAIKRYMYPYYVAYKGRSFDTLSDAEMEYIKVKNKMIQTQKTHFSFRKYIENLTYSRDVVRHTNNKV